MKKKRPPISQLRQAGKLAKQMLIERGLLTKESSIDRILQTDGSPILPGIPAYLPHAWTLKGAQRIMYDLLREWQLETKGEARQENITDFFTFAVQKMNEQESMLNAEIVNTPKMIKMLKKAPLLRDVFSPLRKKEAVKAMNRFFVDSFAVSIVVKSNTNTSEYADWFLHWTGQLYELWTKKDQDKEIQKVHSDSPTR